MRELTFNEKQWLFSEDTLHSTPSRLDGIGYEDELARRARAIDLMRSYAVRAQADIFSHDPSHTRARGFMTLGATMIHRFYMRRSFNDFKEEIIASTVLFLASKIEEDSIKLRWIVNAVLIKDGQPDKMWDPSDSKYLIQTKEYQRWERDILCAEEIILETLCFDMGIEQPWPVLRRCTRGLDQMRLDLEKGRAAKLKREDVEMERGSEAESSRQAELRAGMPNGGSLDPSGKGKSRASEAIVAELGWSLLNGAHLSPLPILYHSHILAFATLVLVLSLVDRLPLSEGTAAAAEIGDGFRLDIAFDEDLGAVGPDREDIRNCLDQFIKFCDLGIIDPGLPSLIVPEPQGDEPRRYIRRLAPAATQRKETADGGVTKDDELVHDAEGPADGDDNAQTEDLEVGGSAPTEDDLFGSESDQDGSDAPAPPSYPPPPTPPMRSPHATPPGNTAGMTP